MENYTYKKVIRIPFPNEILEKCNTTEPRDCEGYLKELLGEYYSQERNKFYFEITETSSGQAYLDWVYYRINNISGEKCGCATRLNEKEFKVIKPLFDKLKIRYVKEDLRKVEYTHESDSLLEPDDYYLITDDSKILISNNI